MTLICSDCIPQVNFAETHLRLYPSEQCSKCKRTGLCINLDYAKEYLKYEIQETSK